MNIFKKVVRVMAAALIAVAGWGSVGTGQVAQAAGSTYYVSTSGSDGNNGQSTGAPFKTIGKVNGLALQPGDTVLFRCGDTWRGEMLRITRSGLAGSPITFGSYPERDCDEPADDFGRAADWRMGVIEREHLCCRPGRGHERWQVPQRPQPIVPRGHAVGDWALAQSRRGGWGVFDDRRAAGSQSIHR